MSARFFWSKSYRFHHRIDIVISDHIPQWNWVGFGADTSQSDRPGRLFAACLLFRTMNTKYPHSCSFYTHSEREKRVGNDLNMPNMLQMWIFTPDSRPRAGVTSWYGTHLIDNVTWRQITSKLARLIGKTKKQAPQKHTKVAQGFLHIHTDPYLLLAWAFLQPLHEAL